jgi:hypothetical protein
MSLHVQIHLQWEGAIPGALIVCHLWNAANDALTKVTLQLLALAAAVLKEHVASRADYARPLDALPRIRVGAKVALILGQIENDREFGRRQQLSN